MRSPAKRISPRTQRQQPEDRSQRRGLAHAVAAEQRDDLAFGHDAGRRRTAPGSRRSRPRGREISSRHHGGLRRRGRRAAPRRWRGSPRPCRWRSRVRTPAPRCDRQAGTRRPCRARSAPSSVCSRRLADQRRPCAPIRPAPCRPSARRAAAGAGAGGERERDLELALLAVRERARHRRRRVAARPTLGQQLARRVEQRAPRRTGRQKRKLLPSPACTASATLSSALRRAKDAGDLDRSARGRAGRACVGGSARDVVAAQPDLAGVRPRAPGQLATSVVLPAPLGPISA